MRTFKALAVIGTRPEAIKMAPVIQAFRASGWIQPIVVATAQHREMLDQVLGHFQLAVDHDLNVMTAHQSLAEITSKCIAGLDVVIGAEDPDLVIAQGDTTTTFCAALAAFYRNIRFAHVEAGLRTYDLESPFPEEFNRQAVSKLTAIHFAPTEGARQCLRDEGFPDDSITVTGNTVIDALLATAGPIPVRARTGPVGKMLLTVHRRENFGDPLRNIVEAIHALLEQEPSLEILWPVHPNWNVHALAYERLEDHPRVRLSTPLDYPDFVRAMVESDFILSDSGGVQEEAPALARPVLVLRETTERPEAVAAGVARLVGTGVESIVSNVTALMRDQSFYADMARGISPYGDGQASRRIVDRLAKLFNADPESVV